MESLKKTLDEIYFYIQNETIWKIASYNADESCAKKGVTAVTDESKEVLVPFIKVTKGGEETTYYLTNFISDGDKYTDGTFYKHEDLPIGGGKPISKYYSLLCEEEVKNSVLNNLKLDFDSFNDNKSYLGILEFMISGAKGYTVSGVDQVTFNETLFNSIKSTEVQSRAWKSANKTAKEYGYKVTLEKTNLTIAKDTD